jgi:predicted ATP-grasp superfamily ATP-dependent carboligase
VTLPASREQPDIVKNPLRVLIVEYFCAGGGGRRVSAALLTEARGMLGAILDDFAALPGARILTLRRRSSALDLASPHEARVVRNSGFEAAFASALRECDAALVVAPEGDGVLWRLTRAVEAAGVLNLGSSSSAVRTASDKWRTCRALGRAGVPQPWSALVPVRGRVSLDRIERRWRRARGVTGAPGGWILKPLDGYACLGLRAVPAGGNLSAALRAARAHTRRTRVLIQERLSGADASVSLIGDGRRAAALCLNRQRLRKDEMFEYLGGSAPLVHPRAAEALRVARRIAPAIPGLRGYFGVDLLLEADGARVVDVNPRLTTSYIGLRRVFGGNPAAWILDAAVRGRLPSRARARGRVEFSLSCPTSSAGTSAASI